MNMVYEKLIIAFCWPVNVLFQVPSGEAVRKPFILANELCALVKGLLALFACISGEDTGQRMPM